MKAKLQKFPEKSIDDLLNLDAGVNLLFQRLIATENYLPDFFTSDDWKAFNEVLRVQEDAQDELKNRIKEHLTDIQMEHAQII